MISRELTAAELAGRLGARQAGPVEIEPERAREVCRYRPDRRTWLYRGLVLNDWEGIFCFRPVESEFPAGMKEWLMRQPEGQTKAQKTGTRTTHALLDGSETDCYECLGGLEDCCRLIDRWYEEVTDA